MTCVPSVTSPSRAPTPWRRETLLLRLPVPAGRGLQLGDVRQRGRQRLRGRHRLCRESGARRVLVPPGGVAKLRWIDLWAGRFPPVHERPPSQSLAGGFRMSRASTAPVSLTRGFRMKQASAAPVLLPGGFCVSRTSTAPVSLAGGFRMSRVPGVGLPAHTPCCATASRESGAPSHSSGHWH